MFFLPLEKRQKNGGTYFTKPNKYRGFFLGLTGCGFALMYAGIFAGFRLFSLYGAFTALLMTAAATILAIICAWKTDGVIVALAGCAGGYLAPVMLSGENSDILTLFLWLTVLNSGILLAAYIKKWTIVRIAVFVLYCIAAGFRYKAGGDQFWGILCCSTVNWLIFLLPPALSKKTEKSMADYILWAGAWGIWIFLTLPYAEDFSSWCKLPVLIMLFSAAVNG